MEALMRDFHHPYKPYDIQSQLMNAIYDCISEGKIGIFESPTGTGKSLSLICGSLTWLRDSQDAVLQDQITEDPGDNEPSWVMEHAQKINRDAVLEQKSQWENRLSQIRAKELQQKQRYENGEPKFKRSRLEEQGKKLEVSEEVQFELDEYDSGDENIKLKTTPHPPSDQGLSSASLQLMEKLGLIGRPPKENDDPLPTDELKIFYCSRTHSQLTQVVQELRRIDLPASSWFTEKDNREFDDTRGKAVVKHVPLGSRKNLCINPRVSPLSSTAAVNERCLELQQPDTPKDHKCPFLPRKENETLVNDFRDHTLAKIRDIEDLGRLGKAIGICPYYASRATIKPSEIVSLPYPLLLQKSAREAFEISLKGHVVIIDEAHNLMDTISKIHSVSVTQAQLKRSRAQLDFYLQRFRTRLKGKNRVYVAQVVRVVDSISAYIEKVALESESTQGIVDVSDLMAGKGVDQINLYKLMHYLQESRLARKVEGYVNYVQAQDSKAKSRTDTRVHASNMPVLTHVQSFLLTLTNPAAEGRFFYEKGEKDLDLSYMLLDPTHHFREIIEDARAVILAGGTMSPMDDYVRHLLSYVDPARLRTFSCGHIIPKENLIALSVAKGLGGVDFDFTYEKRNSPKTIEALGRTVTELTSIVPDGLVVFFPSYAYLDQVILHWQSKSADPIVQSIWDRLLSKKCIFRESKTTTGIDDILNQYSQSIAAGKGGLLLSVIGGKMSEGINFSDALGRGIIVIGLPFPNIQSAQWKAKIEYVEKSTVDRGGSPEEGKALAREFYENACMRAVNQSIGRAIRHKGDYASILLLDKRYNSARIQGKLPAWIQQGLVKGGSVGSFKEAVGRLTEFFKSKRET